MKKTLLPGLLLLVIAVAGLSSYADTVEKDRGFISVNQSMTKEISPNQAEITIRVETSNKSLKNASEENKTISNKVYMTLKSIIGKDDYIKTSNYNASPQYTYTKDNKKILEKYVVSNSVIVKTKSTDLVSKLIDTAIAQGATTIDNLQFSATNYDCACNDSLAELTKNAYKQANIIASSINAKIMGIKSISSTCNTDNVRPFYGMTLKRTAESVDSSTPIESGKIKIYASIDASFYVK